MDLQVFAKTLREKFIGFEGDAGLMLHQLFSQVSVSALRDCPSNENAFLLTLRTIAPELVALGVSVTILDNGKIFVKDASKAQQEATETAALRASFFAALPESAALRAEFGADQRGFSRYLAYRKGLRLGLLHEPRTRPNALAADDRGVQATVDARLPLEAQLRQRWDLEPETRKQFTGVEAFVAYEIALSRGQVRKLG